MNLTDLDLDVKNLTNDFPEDETNSFLYLRGHRADEGATTYTMWCGDKNNLSIAILGLMERDEDMIEVVMNAAINHLAKREKGMKNIRKNLRKLLKQMD